MHKSRRLERLAGLFTTELGPREAPQVLINHRQQLVGGLFIASSNRVQDSRDVRHAAGPQSVPSGNLMSRNLAVQQCSLLEDVERRLFQNSLWK